MAEGFDLLGDPIPDGWLKRGRPPHIVTARNRSKVMLLLALGWSNERIAKGVGISAPSLRKHYFRELKARAEARDRLDARVTERLFELIEAGNVAAIKEFRKLLDRNDLMGAQAAYADRPAEPTTHAVRQDRAPKVPKLGKKEQAALDAETAGAQSDWGDDLLPAPRRTN